MLRHRYISPVSLRPGYVSSIATRRSILITRPLLQPPPRLAMNNLQRSFSKFYPRLEPRHTKEQLLSQSRHFLDRLKIRFKWALIRQNRPFNVDEISAFVSWVVMGNLLWFIIGTTTFVSLVFYTFDKFLNHQNTRNKYLLKLMKFDTSNFDLDIDENFAMKYKDGKIIFQNLQINGFKIQKICLSLSFQKWHEGKGMIKDLEIYGMRGSSQIEDFDMTQFFARNYEIENFLLKDSLVELNGVKLQIFHCQLDKLRSKWLLYDFFDSDNCTGAINDSLFTIHTKQANRNYASFKELEKINTKQDVLAQTSIFTDVLNMLFLKQSHIQLDSGEANARDEVTKDSMKQMIRFRIDELNIDNLPKPKSFTWLDSGKVEVIADIMFPDEPKESNYETRINEELKSIIGGLYDKLMNRHKDNNNDENNDLTKYKPQRNYVMVDIKLQFKDLKVKPTPEIDPELVKFINNFNPDQIYELTPNDLDTLINDESIFDHHDGADHHGDSSMLNLPTINFRIIENVQHLNQRDFNNAVLTELVSHLNFLKAENDARVKSYKDSSYLIKNLILVGLGVCLI